METFARLTDIPPIAHFDDLFSAAAFRAAPPDWWVALADVEQSTQRILNGDDEDFKSVNFVSAGVIAAVENACGHNDVAAMFTGDGAVLIGPPQRRAAAESALRAVRGWARRDYAIELRTGIIGVSDLTAEGARLELAREVRDRAVLFHARGGAAARLDAMLKADDRYALPPSNEAPDLTGLSCRWDPVPNAHGTVMAVIVLDRSGEPDATLGTLHRRIMETAPDNAPITPERLGLSLRHSWPRMRREARARGGGLAWFPVIGVFAAAKLWGAGVIPTITRGGGSLTADDYRAEIAAHCDAQRAFDGLRYLMDVTPEQCTTLRTLLEAEYAAGRIVHGVSEHERTRFTCLCDGDLSRHVHFVDGDGKGFWQAAAALKERLAALS
jgi:hypothetical protein